MESLYPVIIALVFNAVDIASGIISAIKNKDISSSKLRDGLFKKVGFILCYFVAWLVDTQGNKIGFQFSVDILPIIILYVSIIENICKINTDIIPEKLLEMFNVSGKEN